MALDTSKVYLGRIIEHAVGESKTSKTPQITFKAAVEGVEGGGDVTPTTAYVYLYLTDKAVENTVNALRSLGYTHDSFDQLDPEATDAHSFDGVEVRLRVKYESYNGRDQEKWSFAIGSGKLERMERSKLSGLNAAFGKHLKQNRVVTTPPKRPPVANAGGSYSDIAF